MSTHNAGSDPFLNWIRPWLYGASVYNLVWGGSALLAPAFWADLLGVPRPQDGPLWQAMATLSLAYVPAYWLAARRPFAGRHVVLMAYLAKSLLVCGYLWSLQNETLPPAFGWLILTNGLIWLPAFGRFLGSAARLNHGWWGQMQRR